MAYFEWADDLVIDGGPIDDDHRRLVDQVNRLHDATSEGRGMDVVGQLLQELIEDTQQHLSREEAQMAAVGFPDLQRHKLGHERFIAELHALQSRLEAGSMAVAAQLSALLRDWLSLHIRRGDKELLRFIQSRKAGRR